MNRTTWLISIAALTGTHLLCLSPYALAQENDIIATPEKTTRSNQSTIKEGGRYYVRTDDLNLRSGPSKDATKLGELSLNDEVEVISVGSRSNTMVEIKIISSMSNLEIDLNTKLYVSGDYLKAEKTANTNKGEPSKYIVIQNIASERLRIYERCTVSTDCPHRLVFETEQVAGRSEGPKEDRDQYLSWLGHFKVTKWVKFYQDNQDHYPSWYDPNYPAAPKRGSNPKAWIDKDYLPNPGVGVMRGAFGWYAAMVAPNANSQWLHGTMGWGVDGDTFIKWTRSFWVNLFADPRSAGCSRLENRAIAYVRNLIVPGTQVFRVYAVEAYRDPSRKAYANQKQTKAWEFILTKEGVRQDNGPTSDKQAVLLSNVPETQYLETGKYDVDQYPNAVALKTNASGGEARSGKSGNTYRIDDNKFQGVFLIDEGRFVNYSHPRGLPVGGYSNHQLPNYLETSGEYTDARKVVQEKPTTRNRPNERQRPNARRNP